MGKLPHTELEKCFACSMNCHTLLLSWLIVFEHQQNLISFSLALSFSAYRKWEKIEKTIYIKYANTNIHKLSYFFAAVVVAVRSYSRLLFAFYLFLLFGAYGPMSCKSTASIWKTGVFQCFFPVWYTCCMLIYRL